MPGLEPGISSVKPPLQMAGSSPAMTAGIGTAAASSRNSLRRGNFSRFSREMRRGRTGIVRGWTGRYREFFAVRRGSSSGHTIDIGSLYVPLKTSAAFPHRLVMAGLVPAIYENQHVEARQKAGHDEFGLRRCGGTSRRCNLGASARETTLTVEFLFIGKSGSRSRVCAMTIHPPDGLRRNTS
jgi:hypothetical protein